MSDPAAIVFYAEQESGGTDVFTMHADGSNQVQLTEDAASTGPSWSPDKKKVLFGKGGPGTFDGDLYVMNSDGTGVRRLTRTAHASEGGGGWSPNMRRIVFSQVARRTDGTVGADIFKMRPDGTQIKKLTSHPAVDHQPRWSPNGRFILFTSFRRGTADLYRMRPDGTRVRRVTSGSGDEHSGDWSSDGRSIVFVKRDRDMTESVVVLSDGGSARRTLHRSEAIYNSPRWSPDGSRILFVAGGTYQIYSMSSEDGSDLLQLTDASREHMSADW